MSETDLDAAGVVVVHDLGAPGGAEWSDAFAHWHGMVVAPDLPGHGTAPSPVGGNHELGDAVFALADHLAPVREAQPVVVGVGRNGHSARMLALGGRARALVLVDGLGGPWLDVAARNDALRDARRRLLATPAALEPHSGDGPDPRASLVLAPSDRAFVVEVCRLLAVPVLVVETPASPTPDADRLVGEFGEADLVRIESSQPTDVAAVTTRWWDSRS